MVLFMNSIHSNINSNYLNIIFHHREQVTAFHKSVAASNFASAFQWFLIYTLIILQLFFNVLLKSLWVTWVFEILLSNFNGNKIVSNRHGTVQGFFHSLVSDLGQWGQTSDHCFQALFPWCVRLLWKLLPRIRKRMSHWLAPSQLKYMYIFVLKISVFDIASPSPFSAVDSDPDTRLQNRTWHSSMKGSFY